MVGLLEHTGQPYELFNLFSLLGIATEPPTDPLSTEVAGRMPLVIMPPSADAQLLGRPPTRLAPR